VWSTPSVLLWMANTINAASNYRGHGCSSLKYNRFVCQLYTCQVTVQTSRQTPWNKPSVVGDNWPYYHVLYVGIQSVRGTKHTLAH